jgi:hypothetical protein
MNNLFNEDFYRNAEIKLELRTLGTDNSDLKYCPNFEILEYDKESLVIYSERKIYRINHSIEFTLTVKNVIKESFVINFIGIVANENDGVLNIKIKDSRDDGWSSFISLWERHQTRISLFLQFQKQ